MTDNTKLPTTTPTLDKAVHDFLLSGDGSPAKVRQLIEQAEQQPPNQVALDFLKASDRLIAQRHLIASEYDLLIDADGKPTGKFPFLERFLPKLG